MTYWQQQYPTLQGAAWLLKSTGGTLALGEAEGKPALVLRIGDRETVLSRDDVARPIIDLLMELRRDQ